MLRPWFFLLALAFSTGARADELDGCEADFFTGIVLVIPYEQETPVLSWDAPLLNCDGTPATDGACFLIYTGSETNVFEPDPQIVEWDNRLIPFDMPEVDQMVYIGLVSVYTSGRQSHKGIYGIIRVRSTGAPSGIRLEEGAEHTERNTRNEIQRDSTSDPLPIRLFDS